MKQKVIAIVGPTAVGKTALSIQLAKSINGEIISGDAMQIYKGMDIGTAKIKKEEMHGIPHHMIDVKQPDEAFSVADFKKYVSTYINEITSRGKIPILVGGSGLYIQAILYDYSFPEEVRNDTYTKKLEQIVQTEGVDQLYSRLKEIDPIQAEKIHPNNYRRVIRALEIYESTGKTMTDYQKSQSTTPVYDAILIGLDMDREKLYDRINYRVDLMIEEGLIDEVRTLYNQGFQHAQSMKAIGYKELIPYIEGKQNLETCVDLLKRNSRRYAKRQLTWFRNKLEQVNWYKMEPQIAEQQFEIITKEIEGILKGR